MLKSIGIVIITLGGMLAVIRKPLKEQRLYNQMQSLQFDAAVMSAFMQRAVQYYRSGQLEKTWSGHLSHEATLHDICAENKTDDSGKFYVRKINGKTYNLVWNGEEVKISVDDSLPWCLTLHSNILLKNAADYRMHDEKKSRKKANSK